MEVCVDSIESVLRATRGGAQRLELCSALTEGGLTPSPGVLKVVKGMVSVPVFVMLRPRRGLDFVYSSEEIRAIKIDAQILKEYGADGFVFGALTTDGKVDEQSCREIIEIASPLPVTFHRAFDVCTDVFTSLETVIKLGFRRILTSGGESNAEKGIPTIKQLMSVANNRIIIMPGAGITKENLANILQSTGAKEFHGSAKVPLSSQCLNSKNCKMGSADEESLFVTSSELVVEMIDIASQVLEIEQKEYLTGVLDTDGKMTTVC